MKITFCGELNQNSSAFLKKNERKLVSKLYVLLQVLAIIQIVVSLLFYFIFHSEKTKNFTICLLVIAGVLQLFAIISAIVLSIRKLISYPFLISFDTEIISITMKSILRKFSKNHELSISSTKAVEDYGDFFYVITDEGSVLCQKDLINEGTIEQFEELFKDKIVRLSQVAS